MSAQRSVAQWGPGAARFGRALGPVFFLLLATGLFVCHKHSVLSQFTYRPASDPLWRGLFAQLVHFGQAHLAINFIGLIALATLARHLDALSQAMCVLVIAALGISIGLKLEPQPLAWYVGLSGALYGAFAWLSLRYAEDAATRWLRGCAWAVALLLAVRVASGMLSPHGEALLANVPPAPSAHMFGFLTGLLAYAADFLLRRARRSVK